MNSSFAYLPQNERKKILLICDDIRVYSGVATVAREMVLNTAQHFNWVQIAGAITHPDKGKKLDLSNDTNVATGLKDSSVQMRFLQCKRPPLSQSPAFYPLPSLML